MREIAGSIALDDRNVDAEPGKGDLELVVGSAVEVAGGHDVLSGLGQRAQSEELGRLSAGRGQPCDSAFQGRQALRVDVDAVAVVSQRALRLVDLDAGIDDQVADLAKQVPVPPAGFEEEARSLVGRLGS